MKIPRRFHNQPVQTFGKKLLEFGPVQLFETFKIRHFEEDDGDRFVAYTIQILGKGGGFALLPRKIPFTKAFSLSEKVAEHIECMWSAGEEMPIQFFILADGLSHEGHYISPTGEPAYEKAVLFFTGAARGVARAYEKRIALSLPCLPMWKITGAWRDEVLLADHELFVLEARARQVWEARQSCSTVDRTAQA